MDINKEMTWLFESNSLKIIMLKIFFSFILVQWKREVQQSVMIQNLIHEQSKEPRDFSRYAQKCNIVSHNPAFKFKYIAWAIL